MKVFLFTFAPALLGFVLMAVSVIVGKPIEIRWLFSEVQIIFLAIGAVYILAKGSAAPPPTSIPPAPSQGPETFRNRANRVVGKILLAVAIFYAIAFAIVAHRPS